MLKFSVIVPVYNTEKYLSQCIDSILCQTYQGFELILVNDGSSDGSPEICDRYAAMDPRISVFHKENEGVSLTRQFGALMAKGEYLYFVDADDWIEKDSLEKVALHTDVDIIRFGMFVERMNGMISENFPQERNGYYTKIQIEQEIFPYLIHGETIKYYERSLSAHVFRRTLFLNCMLKDVRLSLNEDMVNTASCMYSAESFFCMPECLYHYRYNDNSATKGRTVFSFDVPLKISRFLQSKINMSSFDFQAQLDRGIVHALFNVIESQFHRREPYKIVKKDILIHISSDMYADTIRKAYFRGSMKAFVMMTALKYRLIFVFAVYARLKQVRRKWARRGVLRKHV